jgi:uncharacterized membrane protein YciS (DUF1049 family)
MSYNEKLLYAFYRLREGMRLTHSIPFFFGWNMCTKGWFEVRDEIKRLEKIVEQEQRQCSM